MAVAAASMMMMRRRRMGASRMKSRSRLSRVESLMNQGLYWRLRYKLSSLSLRKVWPVATPSITISMALTKDSLLTAPILHNQCLDDLSGLFYHFMKVIYITSRNSKLSQQIQSSLTICIQYKIDVHIHQPTQFSSSNVQSFISEYFYL